MNHMDTHVAYLENRCHKDELKQASRGSKMLWTMFSWETLGHGIHVDVIKLLHSERKLFQLFILFYFHIKCISGLYVCECE